MNDRVYGATPQFVSQAVSEVKLRVVGFIVVGRPLHSLLKNHFPITFQSLFNHMRDYVG